ncbi:hypothetical protein J2Z26_003112 [Bacillus luteolus]|nr:hypothetical protein [Cytobacillus luteolus]
MFRISREYVTYEGGGLVGMWGILKYSCFLETKGLFQGSRTVPVFPEKAFVELVEHL